MNRYNSWDGERKVLYWEGSSKKDFKCFPTTVQRIFGAYLFVAQEGRTPWSAKLWKGLGPGVYELVDGSHGNAWRVVYAVRPGDAVHVLHAFQKKSPCGIATAKTDIAMIERRYKAVVARYSGR